MYNVHTSVYNAFMKRKELEKKLGQLSWYFLRHGGKHDVWTNGEIEEIIPRHNEIHELLAKKILKTAQHNMGKKISN